MSTHTVEANSNTYPTSQSPSLGIHRPSDITGMFGGKQSVAAADPLMIAARRAKMGAYFCAYLWRVSERVQKVRRRTYFRLERERLEPLNDK